MGLTRVELVTSRLSGVRSNRLSYRPGCHCKFFFRIEKRRKRHTVMSRKDSYDAPVIHKTRRLVSELLTNYSFL